MALRPALGQGVERRVVCATIARLDYGLGPRGCEVYGG